MTYYLDDIFMPVSRPITKQSPYRCDYQGQTYTLTLTQLAEGFQYRPDREDWVPEFSAFGRTEPALPVMYGHDNPVVIRHIDSGLTVAARCAKVMQDSDEHTTCKFFGEGSIMCLGPLKHTREHDEQADQQPESGDDKG